MGFVDLVSHSNEILDQLRQYLSLRSRIQEYSRVNIDFEKDWAKVTIKHEIKAEDLETSKLLIKFIFYLEEDQSHYFVDLVDDTFFKVIRVGGKTLLDEVVFEHVHCHGDLFFPLFELRVFLLNGKICQVSDTAWPIGS